jgi:hypothetical protein
MIGTIDEIVDMVSKIKDKMGMLRGSGIPTGEISKPLDEFLRKLLLAKIALKRPEHENTLNLPDEYKPCLEAVIKQTGLSRNEIVKRVKDKIENVQGLLTEIGSLLIVAEDLHVKITLPDR